MNMNIFEQIRQAKDQACQGFTSVPNPFWFREYWPSVQKGEYTLLTANTGVGKSRWVRYLVSYYTQFAIEKNYPIKILFFSIEEAEKMFWLSYIRRYMAFNHKIILSNAEIMSSTFDNNNNQIPLPDDIVSKIDSYTEELTKKYDIIKVYEDYRTPTAIYMKILDAIKETKQYESIQYKSGFERIVSYHGPQIIVVIDNFNSIIAEDGEDKFKSVTKLSTKYILELVNKLGISVIAIQQQEMARENNDAQKFGRIEPTLDGLGDFKVIARDVHNAFGLFDPNRGFKLLEWEGYDLTVVKELLRTINMLKSRNGVSTKPRIPVMFHGATDTFASMPPPNECTKEKLKTILNLEMSKLV